MVWNFTWISMMAAAAATAQVVVTTRSDNGSNHAVIVQSGPKDDKPQTTVRKGPGYVVIEQHSNGNSAVIMQRD